MFQEVHLPYGMGQIKARIPKRNLMRVISPNDLPSLGKSKEVVAEALARPLKSERLSDITRKGSKVVILAADAMRPGNYRRLILPIVLEELKSAGVRETAITILDAVGSHQTNGKEQLAQLYGEQVLARYTVVNNDSGDQKSMVNLGRSERGDSVLVNRLIAESDLCIGIGAIQPSIPTGGYSGGVKIFAIGAASIQTIFDTHRARTYWHQTSRCGIVVGNRFREHIESVGNKVLEESRAEFFTIDAVTNSRTEMIGVFAGDAAEVYRQGCSLADKQWRVPVERAADIVVAAVDHPQGSNLYEMNISMAMVTRYPNDILKPGGVFIFVSPCDVAPVEGSPSLELLNLMRRFHDADDIIDEVERHQEHEETERQTRSNFVLQTRTYGTALMIKNFSEVIVAGAKLPNLVRDMHFLPAETVEQAIITAMKLTGKNAEIHVIPRARACVPYIE